MATSFFFPMPIFFYVRGFAPVKYYGGEFRGASARRNFFFAQSDFFSVYLHPEKPQKTMSKKINKELVKTILKVVIYVATAVLSFLGGASI